MSRLRGREIMRRLGAAWVFGYLYQHGGVINGKTLEIVEPEKPPRDGWHTIKWHIHKRDWEDLRNKKLLVVVRREGDTLFWGPKEPEEEADLADRDVTIDELAAWGRALTSPPP
jgi:hypothetical protein